MRAYYFGCWRDLGHYLWLPGPIKVDIDTQRQILGKPRVDKRGEAPWGWSIDGGLLMSLRNMREGVAVHALRDGWTALSFYDCSVDSRPGSTSSFMFDVQLSYDEALAAARASFPEVFDRLTFEVVPA